MLIKKRLCPRCQTGQLVYQQDSKTPMCPYVQHHDGKTCTHFVPMKQSKFQNWLQKFKKRKNNHVSDSARRLEN